MYDETWRPGGCVTFAAAQAARLGLDVAAVTACDAEVEPQKLLPQVTWHVLPAPVTTTFVNTYSGGQRRQRLAALAPPLSGTDIPRAWLLTPLVLIGTVFHDVDEALPGQLAMGGSSMLGLGAQGWLRRRQGEDVLPGQFEPEPRWLAGDAVFVSEEDVLEAERVAAWHGRVANVVLTRGRRGCSVWDARGRFDLPAIDVPERDPTGAGDVFAISFLIRLRECGDALEAARFASAAAALSLRCSGTDCLGDREEIGNLLEHSPLEARRPC